MNALAFMQARSMMYFTKGGTRTESGENLSFGEKVKVLLSGVNMPRPSAPPEALPLTAAYEDVRIPGEDDITLGALYRSHGDSTPLVILFHGYSSEKSSLLEEASAFYDFGCSVLLVDFRGSGSSSGDYTTIGVREASDVLAAVTYAGTNLKQAKLILFGQSMGGGAVLRAVHEDRLHADAIIVEGIFDRMINTVRNRFEKMNLPSFPAAELLIFWGGVQMGFDGFSHNPVDYAADVTEPILFLHGTADRRARIEDGRRVFDAVKGEKYFVPLEGAGHERCYEEHPAEWTAAVEEFLEKQ